jgi:hypothetical protein
MHSNNEVGTIQPIRKISHIIRQFNSATDACVLLHSDAAQSLGKVSAHTHTHTHAHTHTHTHIHTHARTHIHTHIHTAPCAPMFPPSLSPLPFSILPLPHTNISCLYHLPSFCNSIPSGDSGRNVYGCRPAHHRGP